MSAHVTVYGVSLLPPDANSFSYSSPKPVPFLSFNAGMSQSSDEVSSGSRKMLRGERYIWLW